MNATVRHVGIVVSDLQKALDFWCVSMGFTVSRQMEEFGPHIDQMMALKDVRVTTIKLSDKKGNMVELLKFKSHPDKDYWSGMPYSTGVTHVALTVDDLESMYKNLNDKDLEFLTPPLASPDGRVRVTYARGPEGLLLELVEEL